MQLEHLEISPLSSSSEVSLATSISALKQSYTLWSPLRFLKKKVRSNLKRTCKRCLGMFGFETPSPSFTKYCSVSLVLAFIPEKSLLRYGRCLEQVLVSYFCTILHRRSSQTPQGTTGIYFFYLQSTQWPLSRLDALSSLCKISMVLSKINFSSWSCSVLPFSGYASDLDEKLFFRTVSSAGPGQSR